MQGGGGGRGEEAGAAALPGSASLPSLNPLRAPPRHAAFLLNWGLSGKQKLIGSFSLFQKRSCFKSVGVARNVPLVAVSFPPLRRCDSAGN